MTYASSAHTTWQVRERGGGEAWGEREGEVGGSQGRKERSSLVGNGQRYNHTGLWGGGSSGTYHGAYDVVRHHRRHQLAVGFLAGQIGQALERELRELRPPPGRQRRVVCALAVRRVFFQLDVAQEDAEGVEALDEVLADGGPAVLAVARHHLGGRDDTTQVQDVLGSEKQGGRAGPDIGCTRARTRA